MLVHWLRAGGRLRRHAVMVVPPVVILGQPALGLLGLVLWMMFVASGWVALAFLLLLVNTAAAGAG